MRAAQIWENWRNGNRSEVDLRPVQQRRLESLAAFARASSPFYEELYRGLPPRPALQDIPPVTKPQLMENFDAWATDPAVTRAGVEAFAADPSRIGDLYLGKYAVWVTSGTTGSPGIFLQDRKALEIYGALSALRNLRGGPSSAQILRVLRRGLRVVMIVSTAGHYAGIFVGEAMRRRYARLLGERFRILSILDPLSEWVKACAAIQPTILVTYPSVLILLAQEQLAGRLALHPAHIISTSEWLDPVSRRQIETAFDCPVRNLYGASEFGYIAFECSRGWLHVNADWCILEPVGADGSPVPPGTVSSTVLLTNLANRVQPLIRYDLGDRLLFRGEPCPCGNPLPALRVEGRQDDTLAFVTESGRKVELVPMALETVVEETPGVRRYQVIQTGAGTLSVRLEASEAGAEAAVWEQLSIRLREFLARQGLPGVTLRLDDRPPSRDPVSGKYRQVWREIPGITLRNKS